jgi:hypothetical protein
MDQTGISSERENIEDDLGCAFVLDEPDGRRACGARRRKSSSYCPHHHAVCYVVSGSDAELKRLQEVEALASAVGGRRARRQALPSRQFLRRLEQTVRDLS